MTSHTAIKPPTTRRRGFTLVEMLIVIGLIVLLIGILLPALSVAYTHAVRNRMALDIQSIATALEAYKADFRDYPQLDYNDTAPSAANSNSPIMTAAYPASVLLCRALIAPGTNAEDGAGTVDASGSETNQPELPGPGFRVIPNGKVYGPYLEPGRFKLVQDPILPTPTAPPSSNGQTQTLTDANNSYLADRYGHPILYFKAFTPAIANIRTAAVFVNAWTVSSGNATRPLYNINDDIGSATNPALAWATDSSPAANALTRMQIMMGDLDADGKIAVTSWGAAEQPATTQGYLLWGAGPDEQFGISLVDSNKNPITSKQTLAGRVPSCDDVLNFKP